MEVKFFTAERVLDLSGQKITVQDNNSRFNDKMFSKYLFPFEIYMNEEFSNGFGDYESHDSFELQNTFEGTLLFENKLHQAKLVLLSIEGKLLTGQIDFGFEDLPNFNKKLAELPLHKFSVTDIHTYAKTIAEKKYPQTDFNFPRMYTKKYPPDQSLWDAFDGYYNDLKTDGSEMRRNYIDDQGNIYNLNIIHPTPHILYVLKTGFQDAGLTLAGDILTDPVLSQRWMFSGTEYFSRLTQRRNEITLTCNQWHSISSAGQMRHGQYSALITLGKKGRYKIRGHVWLYWSRKYPNVSFDLYLNNVKIWNRGRKDDIVEAFNIDLNVTADNAVLRWEGRSSFQVGENFNVMQMSAFSEDLDESAEPGEDNGVITNLNEVDLTRAVPDITFGELVNMLRNRFNYDVTVAGDVVFMNQLGSGAPATVKDMRQAEVFTGEIKRTLLGKRSFVLRSPQYDDSKENFMYYDVDGAMLNKEPREDTQIIETDVIILKTGIPKPNGYDTAIIKKDSSTALQLVYYDGLTGVQNNAKNPAGADFPELFYTHWEKWLRQRITGMEYQWKFYWPADQFDFRINDQIFAYNNIHNIKAWTKELNGETYEVDITTETI